MISINFVKPERVELLKYIYENILVKWENMNSSSFRMIIVLLMKICTGRNDVITNSISRDFVRDSTNVFEIYNAS